MAETEQKKTERDLLDDYVIARGRKEELDRQKAEAEKILATATNALVEFLQDVGKRSTGQYEELGSVTLKEPIPRPHYDKIREAEVFEFVRASGGTDIIKPAIHPATFSSFIREIIKEGRQVPDFIEIYLQPSVLYLPPKKEE